MPTTLVQTHPAAPRSSTHSGVALRGRDVWQELRKDVQTKLPRTCYATWPAMPCLPYCTSKPSLLRRSLPRFHFFDSFLLHLTVVSAPALRPLHSTPPLPPPRPHSFLSLNLYELMLILAISSHSVSHSPSLPHLPRQQQGHHYSAVVTRGMAARLGMAWPTAPTIQHRPSWGSRVSMVQLHMASG